MNSHKMSGNVTPRPTGTNIELTPLVRKTLLRSIRYPVATTTAIALTILASKLVELVPTHTIWFWFARFWASATAGYVILLFLILMASIDTRRIPPFDGTFRYLLLTGAISGLTLSAPIMAIGALVPPEHWLPVTATWMYPWADFSLICLGALWPAVVWPSLLIAWPLSVKYGMPLMEGLYFVWGGVECAYFRSYRWTLALGLIGSAAAITPWLAVCVVPLLSSLSMVLFETSVRECEELEQRASP